MMKKKLTSLDILDGTVDSGAVLSRTEMKQILAGSGSGSGCKEAPCYTSAGCGLCCTCNVSSGYCVDDGSCV